MILQCGNLTRFTLRNSKFGINLDDKRLLLLHRLCILMYKRSKGTDLVIILFCSLIHLNVYEKEIKPSLQAVVVLKGYRSDKQCLWMVQLHSIFCRSDILLTLNGLFKFSFFSLIEQFSFFSFFYIIMQLLPLFTFHNSSVYGG